MLYGVERYLMVCGVDGMTLGFREVSSKNSNSLYISIPGRGADYHTARNFFRILQQRFLNYSATRFEAGH